MPRPGTVRTSRMAIGSSPRAAAAATMARAKPCSEWRSSPAARASTSSAAVPSLSMATTRASTRGERAGLVEGDQPHARKRLERGRVAHQAAVPGQPSDAQRGGHRCRQPDRARTGHHQYREADQQRAVERQVLRPVHCRSRRRARERSARTRRQSDRQGAGSGCGGCSASRTDRQICAQRVAFAAPAASDQERAFEIDAAGDHLRADALGDLPAFASDHGLVGVRFALDDHAVDGNALPRPNPHQHAGANLAHRPAVLSVAVDDGGPLAFRRQQRLQVARRPCTPGGVEIVAHGEQHQHHAGGVEIDLRAALDRREGRIGIGGADAEHDQRRGGQAGLAWRETMPRAQTARRGSRTAGVAMSQSRR